MTNSSDQATTEYLATFFDQASPLLNCLLPLLSALGWTGEKHQLIAALPYLSNYLNRSAFIDVMQRLRYRMKTMRVNLTQLDTRFMPCLFIGEKGETFVVLQRQEKLITIFDGVTNQQKTVEINSLNGHAYLFEYIKKDERQQNRERINWFKNVLLNYKKEFTSTFMITFILSLLALAVPFFIMAVYNHVISTNSFSTLAGLSIGVFIALGGTVILQLIRAKTLAYIAARLDQTIGAGILKRLLLLPVGLIESASIGSQLSRIKDFDTVRDFFTGPLMTLIFELPFIIILIMIIAVLGGYLALVSLTMVLLFIVSGFCLRNYMEQNVQDTAASNFNRHRFLIETITRMRAIKYNNAQDTWLERYRKTSAKAAMANLKTTLITSSINVLSDAIVIISGITVLAFGVLKILDHQLTTGALIAIMMITWRTLSPLKALFIASTMLSQILASIKQMNNLMRLTPEHEPEANYPLFHPVHGKIIYNQVSIRFTPDTPPALVGLSFKLEPGEILAITGRNGAGKSTVLKLFLRLYTPQGGAIYINDMDIKQIDPLELRSGIAYLPQINHFFYGTIEQNVRFARPTATIDDIQKALLKANLWDEIMLLPKGLQTQVRDQNAMLLPISFQLRLGLARVYLKDDAKIILLDEAIDGLNTEDDGIFMDVLKSYRGDSTVMMVSQHPSHLRLADRLLVLDAGKPLMLDTPDKVLPLWLKEQQ